MAMQQIKKSEPGKRTALFLSSECQNEGQIVQGPKIIKNLAMHGWKYSRQRLNKRLKILHEFNIVDCSILDEGLELEQMRCLIESELQVHFKAAKGNAFYIFYSGISYQNGDWAISKKGNSDRLLRVSLSYIVNKWNQLKNKQRPEDRISHNFRLIIFLDSSYSGAWCRRLSEMPKNESKDISIFASTCQNQKAVDNKGGLFFNCLFSLHNQQYQQSYQELNKCQHPCYITPQSNDVFPLDKQQLTLLYQNFSKAAYVSPFYLKQQVSGQQLINDTQITASEIYTGNFIIDKKQKIRYRHGFGELTVKQGVYKGMTYVGYWKQGKAHGTGTLKFQDGYQYYGQFKNGFGHGFARQKIPLPNDRERPPHQAKQIYIGMFKNGLRHGEGSLLFFGGNQYRGTFKQGKRQGYGSMIYSFGVYEGYWKNGLRHGEGLLREKDKSFYEGQWENDQRHGYGCYYSSISNVSYKGLFLNDKKQGGFMVKKHKIGPQQMDLEQKITYRDNLRVYAGSIIYEQNQSELSTDQQSQMRMQQPK